MTSSLTIVPWPWRIGDGGAGDVGDVDEEGFVRLAAVSPLTATVKV